MLKSNQHLKVSFGYGLIYCDVRCLGWRVSDASDGVLHTAAVMGYRINSFEMAIKSGAYNQVVILELQRISFPPQVLPNGQVMVIFNNHAHCKSIETKILNSVKCQGQRVGADKTCCTGHLWHTRTWRRCVRP